LREGAVGGLLPELGLVYVRATTERTADDAGFFAGLAKEGVRSGWAAYQSDRRLFRAPEDFMPAPASSGRLMAGEFLLAGGDALHAAREGAALRTMRVSENETGAQENAVLYAEIDYLCEGKGKLRYRRYYRTDGRGAPRCDLAAFRGII
jgi:hypothetical protein